MLVYQTEPELSNTKRIDTMSSDTLFYPNTGSNANDGEEDRDNKKKAQKPNQPSDSLAEMTVESMNALRAQLGLPPLVSRPPT